MRAVAVAIFALSLAVPAQASQVLSKLPKQLDPAKAYAVVEIGKVDDGILPGILVLSRYDTVKGEIAEPTPKPERHKGGWPLDNRLHLRKALAKAKDQGLYLAELDPGLWVIEGTNDTAFSLGSSTLELAAGSIIDLGVVTVYSDFPEGEKRDVLDNGRLLKSALVGGLFGGRMPKPMPKALEFRARTTNDMPLPALVAQARASYTWAGEATFGNHLGGLVNRMGGRKARPRANVTTPASGSTGESAEGS